MSPGSSDGSYVHIFAQSEASNARAGWNSNSQEAIDALDEDRVRSIDDQV
jgi:hypothetical protein